MARMARAEVFAPDEVTVVHAMNRVVRLCYLLGDDPVSGKRFTRHGRRTGAGTVRFRMATGGHTPPNSRRLSINRGQEMR